MPTHNAICNCTSEKCEHSIDADIAVFEKFGIKVEIHANGDVVAYTNGKLQRELPEGTHELVKTPTPVPVNYDRPHPVHHYMVGTCISADNTIYAGISPSTGRPMYTTVSDVRGAFTWAAALDKAKSLRAHGHKDWRVPTKDELNVMFMNRAVLVGFNLTGSVPDGWYWTSTQVSNTQAWTQRFECGKQFHSFVEGLNSLRCVRG